MRRVVRAGDKSKMLIGPKTINLNFISPKVESTGFHACFTVKLQVYTTGTYLSAIVMKSTSYKYYRFTMK